ncbi:hypothetical protein ACQ4PT_062927 [Festuca glaucescens]
MLIFIAIIFFPAVGTPAGASSGRSMSLQGCPDKCGDVPIPYPFGIGTQCAATSLNSYFNLICDSTTDPPRPMVGDPGTEDEITDISLEHGEMRVLSPVSYICFKSNTKFNSSNLGYDLQLTPFLPSPSRNRFTVIGCNTLGLVSGYKDTASQYVAGCYSYCEGVNNTTEGAPCAGMGSCETAIPANLTSFGVLFQMNQSKVWRFNPCFYGMVAEVGWYNFSQQDLVGRLGFINDRAKKGAPVIADWAIRNGSCPEKGKDKPNDYACVSANSYCTAVNNGPGYLCQCSKGYEGNPYLPNGCQDGKSGRIGSTKDDLDIACLITIIFLDGNFPLKFHQKKHQTMLDTEIIEDAGTGVLEKMAELAVHCLSPRGDDRPTMKEVAERLQMMRRLQFDATGAHENSSYAENYKGAYSVVPFDETTQGTIGMSELVEDLAR